MKLAIHGLTADQALQTARERVGTGGGAARAVYRTVMEAGRFEPEAAGLGARACAGFRANFDFRLPELVRIEREDTPRGPTAKAVLRLADGLEVECVSIPMGRGRYTLCLSSQVGCRRACAFCETGRMGFVRQLTAAEIVAQVLVARHSLGWSVRNLVFMGMGEALDNPEGLFQALRVLTDGAGLSFAQGRLTVCTVGNVEGIGALAAEAYPRLNLSVSLNAANDALRDRLMPINRRVPLAALQEALLGYRQRRNFCLGVNYCLMPGLNDSPSDAEDVAKFVAPLGRSLVYLIPYNPGGVALTRAPTEREVACFVGLLREQGVAVRARITKGRSVMAACGQLGNVALRRPSRATRSHDGRDGMAQAPLPPVGRVSYD